MLFNIRPNMAQGSDKNFEARDQQALPYMVSSHRSMAWVVTASKWFNTLLNSTKRVLMRAPVVLILKFSNFSSA